MSAVLLASAADVPPAQPSPAELARREKWNRALWMATRRREQAAASANPYQQCFANFLYHCCWTIDEAGGGASRQWPRGLGDDGKSWDQLWRELERHLLNSRVLFLEKSRRVLASWLTCCFDIWLAGGGQDARWRDEKGRPVLTRSDRNRTIVVAARKAEGEAGSEWFIKQRIVPILEAFEEHNCRALWPQFPTWTAKAGQVQFSNGSRIVGVPSGSDQLRGAAATLLHFEEVAFWTDAASTIGGALPTLRGGGHCVMITTAKVGTYAADLRNDKLKARV